MHNGLLVISILCSLIIIDETYSFRIRSPGLRLSATFSRAAAELKKKFYLDDNKMTIPEESSRLKDRPPQKNEDF
jgi:hypothetical protein